MLLTYTVDGEIIKVNIDDNSWEKIDIAEVYAIRNGIKGRPCKKRVHFFDDSTFIWWNGEKLNLNNYEPLSLDEFFEKYNKKTIAFDEIATTLTKRDDIALWFWRDNTLTKVRKTPEGALNLQFVTWGDEIVLECQNNLREYWKSKSKREVLLGLPFVQEVFTRKFIPVQLEDDFDTYKEGQLLKMEKQSIRKIDKIPILDRLSPFRYKHKTF